MLEKEKKIQEDLSFLRELNSQLLANQTDLKDALTKKEQVRLSYAMIYYTWVWMKKIGW
jgi:hypothetical protein